MENPPQSTMSKVELRQIKNREKCRRYREKYREILNEKKKETIQCECGMVVNKRHASQHRGNSRHLKNIMQYKVECLDILENAFGSNIATSVFSFLV